MKTLIIIPARFASTRFPGKPLAILGGKPVIQWVWECASTLPSATKVVVATDDERIAHAVGSFGGSALMTSDKHRSGTDRCGEVMRMLELIGDRYDVVVNIQGDEPFIRQEQIQDLIKCFETPATQIATMKTPFTATDELFSYNNVKVVCDINGDALYFSRQPIPYLRGAENESWLQQQKYYKHVGVYAFRADVLKEVVYLPASPLEKSESLEQLRWLENGYRIKVMETASTSIGIDTPEDLAAAETLLKETALANNRVKEK